MKKELITVYDFAERKGVSHTTAYKQIKAGTIKAEKIGNNLFVDWNKYETIDIELSPKGRRKAV